MSSIWNNKLKGIPGMLVIVVKILCVKVVDKLNTWLFLNNIQKHGQNALVMHGCVYRYPQWIEMGSNIIVGKHTSLTAGKCICYCGEENKQRGYLVINNGVSIGNNCELDFSGGIVLEEEAHIAHHVLITTHDHGFDYRNEPVGKSLVIGRRAFVGSHSIILFNCNRIGNNAVIGAGSVVTKDVPDNAIVAGNPARVIKYIDGGK